MALVDDILSTLDIPEKIGRAQREEDNEVGFIEASKKKIAEAREEIGTFDGVKDFFGDVGTAIGATTSIVGDVVDEGLDKVGDAGASIVDFGRGILAEEDAGIGRKVLGGAAAVGGSVLEGVSNASEILQGGFSEAGGLAGLYDAAVSEDETIFGTLKDSFVSNADKALGEDAENYTDNQKLFGSVLGATDILGAAGLAKGGAKAAIGAGARALGRETVEEGVQGVATNIARQAGAEVGETSIKQVDTIANTSSKSTKAANTADINTEVVSTSKGTKEVLEETDTILKNSEPQATSLLGSIRDKYEGIKAGAKTSTGLTSVGKVFEGVSNAYTYLDPVAKGWFKAVDTGASLAKGLGGAALDGLGIGNAFTKGIVNTGVGAASLGAKFGGQFVFSPGARGAGIEGIVNNYNESAVQQQRAFERSNELLGTTASFGDYTAFREQVNAAYNNFNKQQSATSKNANKTVLANLINNFVEQNGGTKRVSSLKDLTEISQTVSGLSSLQRGLIAGATGYDYLTRRNIFQNAVSPGYLGRYENGAERDFDQSLKSISDSLGFDKATIDALYNSDKDSEEYKQAREAISGAISEKAKEFFEEQQPIGTNPTLRAQIREQTVEATENAVLELERQLGIDQDEKIEGAEVALLYLTDELKEVYNDIPNKGHATTLLSLFGNQIDAIDQDIEFLEEDGDVDALLAAETNKEAKEAMIEVMYRRLEYIANNDGQIGDVDQIGKDVIEEYYTTVKNQTQRALGDGFLNDTAVVSTKELLTPVGNFLRDWTDDAGLYSTNRLSLENKSYAGSLLADSLDNFEGLGIMFIGNALQKAFGFRTKKGKTSVSGGRGRVTGAAEFASKVASGGFEELYVDLGISGISGQPISTADYMKTIALGAILDTNAAYSQNTYYRSKDLLDIDGRFIDGTIDQLRNNPTIAKMFNEMSYEKQVEFVQAQTDKIVQINKENPQFAKQLNEATVLVENFKRDFTESFAKQKTDIQQALATNNANNVLSPASFAKLSQKVTATGAVNPNVSLSSDIEYTPEYRSELTTFVKNSKQNTIDFMSNLESVQTNPDNFYSQTLDGGTKGLTIDGDGDLRKSIREFLPNNLDFSNTEAVIEAVNNLNVPATVKSKINGEIRISTGDLSGIRSTSAPGLLGDWTKAIRAGVSKVKRKPKEEAIAGILDRKLGTLYDDAQIIVDSQIQQIRESYPILNQYLNENKPRIDHTNSPAPLRDLGNIPDTQTVVNEDGTTETIEVLEGPYIIGTTVPLVLSESELRTNLANQGKSELDIRKYVANLERINELIYFYNHALNIESQELTIEGKRTKGKAFYNTYAPSSVYKERLSQIYGVRAEEYLYDYHLGTDGSPLRNIDGYLMFKISGDVEKDRILNSMMNRLNYSAALSESGRESYAELADRYRAILSTEGLETDLFLEKFLNTEGIPPYRNGNIDIAQQVFSEMIMETYPDKDVAEAVYVGNTLVNIANSLFDSFIPSAEAGKSEINKYFSNEPQRLEYILSVGKQLIEAGHLPTIEVLGTRNLTRDKEVVDIQAAVKRAKLGFRDRDGRSEAAVLSKDVSTLNIFDPSFFPFSRKDGKINTKSLDKKFLDVYNSFKGYVGNLLAPQTITELYNEWQHALTQRGHIQGSLPAVNTNGITIMSFDDMQLRYRNNRQEGFGTKQEELALYADYKKLKNAERNIVQGGEVAEALPDPQYIFSRLATLEFGENITDLVYFTASAGAKNGGRIGGPGPASLAAMSSKFRNEYAQLDKKGKLELLNRVESEIIKETINQNYDGANSSFASLFLDDSYVEQSTLDRDSAALELLNRAREGYGIPALEFNFKQGNFGVFNRQIYTQIFKKLGINVTNNKTTTEIRRALVNRANGDVFRANEILNDAIKSAIVKYNRQEDAVVLKALEARALGADKNAVQKMVKLNQKIQDLGEEIFVLQNDILIVSEIDGDFDFSDENIFQAGKKPIDFSGEIPSGYDLIGEYTIPINQKNTKNQIFALPVNESDFFEANIDIDGDPSSKFLGAVRLIEGNERQGQDVAGRRDSLIEKIGEELQLDANEARDEYDRLVNLPIETTKTINKSDVVYNIYGKTSDFIRKQKLSKEQKELIKSSNKENKSKISNLKKKLRAANSEYNVLKRANDRVTVKAGRALDNLEEFYYENILFHDGQNKNNMMQLKSGEATPDGFVPVYSLKSSKKVGGNMQLYYRDSGGNRTIYAPIELFDKPFSKLSEGLIEEFNISNPKPLDITNVSAKAAYLGTRVENVYKLLSGAVLESEQIERLKDGSTYNGGSWDFVSNLISDPNVASLISSRISSVNQTKETIESGINDVINLPGVRDAITNWANREVKIEALKGKMKLSASGFTVDVTSDTVSPVEALDRFFARIAADSKYETTYIDAFAQLIQDEVREADDRGTQFTLDKNNLVKETVSKVNESNDNANVSAQLKVLEGVRNISIETANELVSRIDDIQIADADTAQELSEQTYVQLSDDVVKENIAKDRTRWDTLQKGAFAQSLGEIADAAGRPYRELQNWYAGRLSSKINLLGENKSVNEWARELNSLLYNGSRISKTNRQKHGVDQKLKDVEAELRQAWATRIPPTGKEAQILLGIIQHFQTGINENMPTEIINLLEDIPRTLFNDSKKLGLVHDRITGLIATTAGQGSALETLGQLNPGYYSKILLNGKADVVVGNTQQTESLTNSNDKFRAIFQNQLNNDEIGFLLSRLGYTADHYESNIVSALTSYGPLYAGFPLAGREFIKALGTTLTFGYNGQTGFSPKNLLVSLSRANAFLKMAISYGLAPFNAGTALLAQMWSVVLQYQGYRGDVMRILGEDELNYIRNQTNLGNDLTDIAAQLSQGAQNLALDVLARGPILDLLADNYFMERGINLSQAIDTDGNLRDDVRADITEYMRVRFRQVFGAAIDGKLNSRNAGAFRTIMNPLGTWAANQSRTFMNNVAGSLKRRYVTSIENGDLAGATSGLYNNIENTRFISSTLRSLNYARRLCELEQAVTNQGFGYTDESFEQAFDWATCGTELLNQFESPVNILAGEGFQSSPTLRAMYQMYKAMTLDFGGESDPKLLLGFTAFFENYRKAMLNNTWINDAYVTGISQALIDQDVNALVATMQKDLQYKFVALSNYLASDQEQDLNSGRPVERGVRRIFLGSDYFNDLKYDLKPGADAKAIQATPRGLQNYILNDFPIIGAIYGPLFNGTDANPFLNYNDPQEMYDFMVTDNRVGYKELVNGNVPADATDEDYRYMFRLMRYFGPGILSNKNKDAQNNPDFSDSGERELFYTNDGTVRIANQYLKESMSEEDYAEFTQANLQIDWDKPWDDLKSNVYTDALAKYNAKTPGASMAMLGAVVSMYEDNRAKALGFFGSGDKRYYQNEELQNRVQSELGRTFGKFIKDSDPGVWGDYVGYAVSSRIQNIVEDPTTPADLAEDLSQYAKDATGSIGDSTRLNSGAIRKMIFFDVTADKYAETGDVAFIEGMNSTLRTIPDIKSLDNRRFPTAKNSGQRKTINEYTYLERRIKGIEELIGDDENGFTPSDIKQFNDELLDYKVQLEEIKPEYDKVQKQLADVKDNLTPEQEALRDELNDSYYAENEAFHIGALVHTHQELVNKGVPEQRADKYVMGILSKSGAMLAAGLANPEVRELLGDTADYAAKIIFETGENAVRAEAAKNDLERAVGELQNGYGGSGSGRRSSGGQYRGIGRHSSKYSDTPLEDYKAIKLATPKVKALTKSLLKTYKPTNKVNYKKYKTYYDGDQFKRLYSRARYESLISDKIVTSELTKQKPKFKVKIKQTKPKKSDLIKTPDPLSGFEAPEFEPIV